MNSAGDFLDYMQDLLLAGSWSDYGPARILTAFTLALVGAGVAHTLAIRRQRRKERLEFLSAQLEQLYGPLFALIEANKAAYDVFADLFPLPRDFSTYTDEQRELWKAWANDVFVPSNEAIRDLIVRKAHLFVEGRMPDILLQFVAHAESSKLIRALQADGGEAVLRGFPPWPVGLNEYVRGRYEQVADAHSTLLGRAIHLHKLPDIPLPQARRALPAPAHRASE